MANLIEIEEMINESQLVNSRKMRADAFKKVSLELSNIVLKKLTEEIKKFFKSNNLNFSNLKVTAKKKNILEDFGPQLTFSVTSSLKEGSFPQDLSKKLESSKLITGFGSVSYDVDIFGKDEERLNMTVMVRNTLHKSTKTSLDLLKKQKAVFSKEVFAGVKSYLDKKVSDVIKPYKVKMLKSSNGLDSAFQSRKRQMSFEFKVDGISEDVRSKSSEIQKELKSTLKKEFKKSLGYKLEFITVTEVKENYFTFTIDIMSERIILDE